MKLDQLTEDRSPPQSLLMVLAKLLKANGWKVDLDTGLFTATFSSTPEGALNALKQGIALLELHDMTFAGKEDGSPLWEIRIKEERKTYFADARLWSMKRKPTALINFYEG